MNRKHGKITRCPNCSETVHVVTKQLSPNIKQVRYINPETGSAHRCQPKKPYSPKGIQRPGDARHFVKRDLERPCTTCGQMIAFSRNLKGKWQPVDPLDDKPHHCPNSRKKDQKDK